MTMQTPVEIDFQGMASRPDLQDAIGEHVNKLETRYGRMTACRVVLKGPGGHHQTGGLYEVNHAIRGLPQDRIRFHLCWGSWHGPHVTDLPMRDIIDVMLAINCQAYSFEAGNVRHEHEWSVWRDVKLPDDTLLLPGIVSHATNVVEHPDLVAERIGRFAAIVGKERVIASTDCGLGGRIHPDIAWAKLESLAEGSRRASKQLWR